MIGYLKDPRTFKTTHLLDVSSYDLVLGSIYNDTSKVEVVGEYNGLEHYYFIFEDNIWVVKAISPEDGITTFTLDPIDSIFSRNIVFYDDNTESIEDFIAYNIYYEFVTIDDPYFSCPYISVSFSTGTEFVEPDVDGVLFNLADYISKVRLLYNVFLRYRIEGDTLHIIIDYLTPEVHKIDFSGSDSQVINEVYQKSNISKVTVNGDRDYYLFEDGTFSQDPYGGVRVEGEWGSLQIGDTEDEVERVYDIFASNSNSHVIEFYTTQDCHFFDNVEIRSRGVLTSSYLTVVRKTSDDSRLYCKTGELITTVSSAIANMHTQVSNIQNTLTYIQTGGGSSGDGYVPTSRKINGKTLATDIVLNASDVGALPSSTVVPTALSQLTDDSTHRLVTDTDKSKWNSKSEFSGSYDDLTNKPSINNVTLTSNKSLDDLNIQVKGNYADTVLTNSEIEQLLSMN